MNTQEPSNANAILNNRVRRLKRAEAILDERDRQDEKWGIQDHSLPEWLVILAEEIGELATATLGHIFGTDKHPEMDWRKEAVQVAAVALAMLEQYEDPCLRRPLTEAEAAQEDVDDE